jgi:1-aminocyclopropane-1-carboxylate deaminase/D-cysteine desulfhydrase-like pyridoxal-dependent ACC family enzyme
MERNDATAGCKLATGRSCVCCHRYGVELSNAARVCAITTEARHGIGSGGTAAGLAIGARLSGSSIRVHAVGVCDSAEVFHRDIDAILQNELGVSDFTSRDILDVIEGYEGEGYGVNTDQELDWLVRLAHDNGIVFDPTYGLKGVSLLLNHSTMHAWYAID